MSSFEKIALERVRDDESVPYPTRKEAEALLTQLYVTGELNVKKISLIGLRNRVVAIVADLKAAKKEPKNVSKK